MNTKELREVEDLLALDCITCHECKWLLKRTQDKYIDHLKRKVHES